MGGKRHLTHYERETLSDSKIPYGYGIGRIPLTGGIGQEYGVPIDQGSPWGPP